MPQPQSAYRNQIIGALAREDFDALAPHLSAVRLDFRLDLETANRQILRVCFPDSGIISVVARSEGLNTVEVGLVGRDGMTGLPIVMGDSQSPQDTYVQVPGTGHWLDATALSVLLETRPAMRQLMLGYAHVFTTQIAQTALANGRAKIDARLARWLLMVADRLDGSRNATHPRPDGFDAGRPSSGRDRFPSPPGGRAHGKGQARLHHHQRQARSGSLGRRLIWRPGTGVPPGHETGRPTDGPKSPARRGGLAALMSASAPVLTSVEQRAGTKTYTREPAVPHRFYGFVLSGADR